MRRADDVVDVDQRVALRGAVAPEAELQVHEDADVGIRVPGGIEGAGAAVQEVGAGAADQQVVAGEPQHAVVAAVPMHPVVIFIAVQDVGLVASIDIDDLRHDDRIDDDRADFGKCSNARDHDTCPLLSEPSVPVDIGMSYPDAATRPATPDGNVRHLRDSCPA